MRSACAARLTPTAAGGSLAVTIAGITLGLWCGSRFPAQRGRFNACGQVAGLVLMAISLIFSSKRDPIWDREASFYGATCLPCVSAMVLSMIATSFIDLSKPERVAVVIETAYQNVGLATSIAINSFNDEDGSRAAGIPGESERSQNTLTIHTPPCLFLQATRGMYTAYLTGEVCVCRGGGACGSPLRPRGDRRHRGVVRFLMENELGERPCPWDPVRHTLYIYSPRLKRPDKTHGGNFLKTFPICFMGPLPLWAQSGSFLAGYHSRIRAR